MSVARITIEADTSGIAAAFARLRADAKTTENTIAGSLGRASTRAAGAYRTNGRAMRDELDKTAAAAERDAHRSVAAYIRSEEQKRRASTQTARVRTSLEQTATAVAREEARKRGLSTEGEARVRQNALERLTRQHEANERRQTAITRQQERERRNMGRAIGRGVAETGRAGFHAAQTAHGVIQGGREVRAARETAMNNTLVQLVPGGASVAEVSQTRAEILRQTREARLDPDTVIEAIGGAQSFANALGGDTAERRRANLNNTMADVRFASNIDPQNVAGLVRLGAVARQGGMSAADSSSLLRGAAGIGFQGSVETDQMVTRGLPGLQTAWSAGTAGITDPAEMSRRRSEIARDFMAQVQSQAASGRTVTVSANRTNTMREALGNDYRQNRLGEAYARRRDTMTPEQRAAFDSNFTRDERGQYHAAGLASGNASNIARFFGTMHNNDAIKMRNFLGAHGGGGNNQLMNRPDVNAAASYFGMVTNSRGQQVRQYDYTDELARSTITAEQEGTIGAIRGSEESRKLQDDKNAHDMAVDANTGALTRMSDAFAAWVARNPILAPIAGAAAPVVGGLAAKGIGGLAALGAAPAAAITGIVAGAAVGVRTAVTGTDLQGNEVGTGRRVLAGAQALTSGGGSEVGRQIGEYIVNALRSQPIVATVPAVDAAQAASRQPPAGR